MAKLNEKAQTVAGVKIDMASPNDVSRVLFEVLRLNVPKRTKKLQSGGSSTKAMVRCSDQLSCGRQSCVCCPVVP